MVKKREDASLMYETTLTNLIITIAAAQSKLRPKAKILKDLFLFILL